MKRLTAIFLAAALLCLTACAPQNQVSDGAVLLETPVGTLKYPSQYAANTRLETKEEDGLYSYTLYGATGEHEALLFTVYVGERGEGRLFGFAPDGNGVLQAIYVHIVEFTGDDTWTQPELELVWNMQQHVNDVIDQIYELPGFQE